MLSENSFQAVVKVTRDIIATSKHQKIINYKQCIIILENSFVTVLNAIREFITNSINTIREKG